MRVKVCSLVLPSGFRTALSKSNRASAESLILSAVGFGAGAAAATGLVHLSAGTMSESQAQPTGNSPASAVEAAAGLQP